MWHLDYDLVVAINAEHGGAGAGVRDENGLRAQLARATQTAFGVDPYPTVLDKAAVILHGVASTQNFFDGNKRTAWIAANVFLEANGHALREIAPIEAEVFVLAVATRAMEQDGEPDRAIRRAVEWLESFVLRAADRLDYVIVGFEVDRHGDRTHDLFDMRGGQLGIVGASPMPAVVPLGAVVHLRFRPADVYVEWPIRVQVESPTNAFRLLNPNERVQRYVLDHGQLPPGFDHIRDTVDWIEEIATAEEDLTGQEESGVRPVLTFFNLPVLLAKPGDGHFVFTMMGEVLARYPLRVTQL